MELADRIGVSYQQVQKYENEKSQITLRRLLVLANALNTPLTAILSAPAKSRLSDKVAPRAPVRGREERELLDLYAGIESPQLRRTVLHLMRNIVEQQRKQ